MKKCRWLGIALLCLLGFCAAANAELRLSEAVSNNVTLRPDATGAVYDYIVLKNQGDGQQPLAGMTLDDGGELYSLPDISLAPGEELVVYCTGEPGGAPFKLSAKGETLRLCKDGETLWMTDVPALGANARYIDGQIVPDDAASNAVGSIRLNEIAACNTLHVTAGETPDWVELYNAGTEAFDLSGCFLSDDADAPVK